MSSAVRPFFSVSVVDGRELYAQVSCDDADAIAVVVRAGVERWASMALRNPDAFDELGRLPRLSIEVQRTP